MNGLGDRLFVVVVVVVEVQFVFVPMSCLCERVRPPSSQTQGQTDLTERVEVYLFATTMILDMEVGTRVGPVRIPIRHLDGRAAS